MRFSLLSLLLACSLNQDSKQIENHLDVKITPEVNLSVLSIDKSKTSIYISKSKYELSLLEDGEILKTWKTTMGFDPIGDKWRQGDGCTPEGNFKVRDLYPHDRWTKFIWIDYPNEESRKKHAWAKAEGLIESDAAIGGEVGIHGVPAGSDGWIESTTNWTLGCVALKTKAINELYLYIQVGTPIQIEK